MNDDSLGCICLTQEKDDCSTPIIVHRRMLLMLMVSNSCKFDDDLQDDLTVTRWECATLLLGSNILAILDVVFVVIC